MRFTILVATILSSSYLLLSGCSGENGAATSQEHACELVKRAAVELCLSRTNLSGRYYCEPMPESPEHYRVGLRYEVAPDELVGSNLIGWFAIRKADGTVLEEDVADDRLLPLESGCPFETE